MCVKLYLTFCCKINLHKSQKWGTGDIKKRVNRKTQISCCGKLETWYMWGKNHD